MKREITVTTQTVTRSEVAGSFGRKWGIEGATYLPQHLHSARITIGWSVIGKKHGTGLHSAAAGHELGHVGSAQDLRDSQPDDAWDLLNGADRFRLEVEAWARWLDKTDGLSYKIGMFVLDCLNAYRRGLHTSDEEWYEAQRLVASFAHGVFKEHLMRYAPLEPDPGDQMACGFAVPVSVPMDFDPDQEQENGNQDQGRGAEPPADQVFFRPWSWPAPDTNWLTQEVLDELASGRPVVTVAMEHGLDSNRLPPLAQAVIRQADALREAGHPLTRKGEI